MILTGTLRDIAGADTDGTISILSRFTRESVDNPGELITREIHREPIEDGRFRIEGLEAGPVTIELTAGNEYSRWDINLPDDDAEHDLAGLVELQVEWEPDVVSRARAAQRASEDAAERSEAGANRVGSAEAVLEARDQSQTAAGDAIEAAGRSNSDADRAKQEADRASGRATAAGNAADDAAAAREGVDEAAAAATAAAGVVQEATDPLPQLLTDIGSASTTGLSQIADARASALSALDAKAQQSMVPRVDTTVGTRVFVGTTMIFGDTGWRNITSLLANGWTADYVNIRRVGDVVTVRTNRLNGTAATGQTLLAAIAGFRPSSLVTTSFLITHGSEAAVAARWDYASLGIPTYASYSSGRASEISVTTRDTWPTSLPGTPA